MPRPVPAILIAGTHSGVGKTTVATGVVGALRRRGLVVQPFKVGPDYIDPTYTTRLAGRPCRNLDSWMVPSDRLRELYARACTGADIAVVEGVMGLFDGHPGGGAGSAAELAKLLGLPVVLVMDVGRLGQSAAAVALGYSRLDPALKVAGVVANGVGSPGHLRLVADAVRDATGLPVVGYLPQRADLVLPERHL
ncbi:MAG: cobyrinate a,c-diamide synthase, partial [Dehalococcoidales bacterium]|nr:cobyrinate a,c-diamide synthase [Dehalococcoidales bacterium]